MSSSTAARSPEMQTSASPPVPCPSRDDHSLKGLRGTRDDRVDIRGRVVLQPEDFEPPRCLGGQIVDCGGFSVTSIANFQKDPSRLRTAGGLVDVRSHGQDNRVRRHRRIEWQCHGLGSPLGEGRVDVLQSVTPLGQLVGLPDAVTTLLGSSQNTLACQAVQAASEDGGPDPNDVALESCEPFGSQQQLTNDAHAPTLTDDVEGVRCCTAVVVGPVCASTCHPSSLTPVSVVSSQLHNV